MCAAVLIIASGRPHYCDRPPVTEFYKAALLKIKRALLMNNEQLLSEKANKWISPFSSLPSSLPYFQLNIIDESDGDDSGRQINQFQWKADAQVVR